MFTRMPRALGAGIVLVAAFVLAIVLNGCGALGGTETEAKPKGKLEADTVTVSIMKTTDLAPFHLAMQEGYFKDEGLNVEFVQAKSSGESVTKLVGGDVDISYSSYPPFFLAEAEGVANHKGGVKLIADASSAGEGSCLVLKMPRSPIKSIRDLAGKRIAVTGEDSISALLIKSTMKTHGVDYGQVKWAPTPFPATAQVLKAGNVDAAFATEPFIQDAERNAGAEPLVDVATGPTADMPTAGWATLGDFAASHKNTIAAFRRAMQRGTNAALEDRGKVEPLLVEFSGVDEETAKMATLLTFQSKLDASRIQRVPDLMLEFKNLGVPLDVSKMMVPSPTT